VDIDADSYLVKDETGRFVKRAADPRRRREMLALMGRGRRPLFTLPGGGGW
jgi:hypothetical protein